MSFEVQPGEQGPIMLHIRGPDGTKQFVEGARYMLSSHINPAPTLGNKFKQGLRYLTGPLRTLPDFLIIGAKKCGTTALYSYLTQSPSIAPAFRKGGTVTAGNSSGIAGPPTDALSRPVTKIIPSRSASASSRNRFIRHSNRLSGSAA